MAIYNHTGQVVTDLERSKRFYQEVFGFEAAPIVAFAGFKLTFGGPDGVDGTSTK